MAEPHPHKARLRAEFRRRRKAIDAGPRSERDARLREVLAAQVAVIGARRIAAFLPFDGEPDITPLLEEWRTAGLHLALPAIGPGGALRMRDWATGTELSASPMGIREPRYGTERRPSDFDLLLLPLVAWDEQGRRLGMGAGHYDRWLAGVRRSALPPRIGIAYACQQHPGLPADEWDVPLHGVATEEGWFTCPA